MIEVKLLDVDPVTAAWAAGNTDRRWPAFLDYWQNLAERQQRVPARRDLDPVEISAALLSNIFLVDIMPADQLVARTRFRFRLLGSEITAREKVRPGMYLDELGAARDLVPIEAQYHEAIGFRVKRRAASLIWEERSKAHVRYDVIVLPLAGEDGAIAHLMGCAIYENETPAPFPRS